MFVAGGIAGTGAYSIHAVGGGHSITYKEKTKYCDKRSKEGFQGRCVFIGPIPEFQSEGVYFQEGSASNTHRIQDETWLDANTTFSNDTAGANLKEVLNQHPGLRDYLKKWLDGHKDCQFQQKSGTLAEFIMTCLRRQ
ncbi:hypothetical protein MHLP_00380 [Candidatus Mycoplasma haematolamae str. Purdue]|uniref:Uncharacterized protein n=1 Tax=Mycoplasma haematolamae (strain Purdue) TaxID=1212765 RepID=I7CEJ0_MYCHA|nr:hypothetical protein MHLP_00380 [Candidatus Mycoplasma haematolamae str. Purdue]